MLFLVIYLQYRLISLRFRAIRTLMQLAAICAAWITALSRVIDYKVRGSDAIGGAILGGLVAILFSYWIGESYFLKEKYETDFDQIKKENEVITNFWLKNFIGNKLKKQFKKVLFCFELSQSIIAIILFRFILHILYWSKKICSMIEFFLINN